MDDVRIGHGLVNDPTVDVRSDESGHALVRSGTCTGDCRVNPMCNASAHAHPADVSGVDTVLRRAVQLIADLKEHEYESMLLWGPPSTGSAATTFLPVHAADVSADWEPAHPFRGTFAAWNHNHNHHVDLQRVNGCPAGTRAILGVDRATGTFSPQGVGPVLRG